MSTQTYNSKERQFFGHMAAVTTQEHVSVLQTQTLQNPSLSLCTTDAAVRARDR